MFVLGCGQPFDWLRKTFFEKPNPEEQWIEILDLRGCRLFLVTVADLQTQRNICWIKLLFCIDAFGIQSYIILFFGISSEPSCSLSLSAVLWLLKTWHSMLFGILSIVSCILNWDMRFYAWMTINAISKPLSRTILLSAF